jgi:hypothetical protein
MSSSWYSITVLDSSGNNYLNGYFCTINSVVTKFYETVNGNTDFSNNLLINLTNTIINGQLATAWPGLYDGFNHLASAGSIGFTVYQTAYSVSTVDNAYLDGWSQFDIYGIILKPSYNSYKYTNLTNLSYINMWNESGKTGIEFVDINNNFTYIIDFSTTVTPITDPTPKTYPCFKENTKILTNNGYQYIQKLKKGDLVKTFKNDYKPILFLGKRNIEHIPSSERIKKQLYKCSQNQYPEIFEDLIITGCHSILIDEFKSDKEKEKTIEINGDTYITDDYYRLPSCCDERATVYEIP